MVRAFKHSPRFKKSYYKSLNAHAHAPAACKETAESLEALSELTGASQIISSRIFSCSIVRYNPCRQSLPYKIHQSYAETDTQLANDLYRHLTMSSYHTLPHHVHVTPSRPISTDTALVNIQSYLALTTTEAYLHPDVIFTSSGPTASTSLTTGGLVLHQLRRVEAGLRGEYIAVELADLERMRSRSGTPILPGSDAHGENGLSESNDARLDRLIAGTLHAGGNAEANGFGDNEEVPFTYQEQLGAAGHRDEIGEIGDRDNAVRELDHIPKLQTTKTVPASGGQKKRPYDDGGATDKASRKKAKKARMAEEKVQRAQARMAGNEVEMAGGGDVEIHGNDRVELGRADDMGDDFVQNTYQGDEVGEPVQENPAEAQTNGNGIHAASTDGTEPETKTRRKKSRKSEGADIAAPESRDTEDKMDIDIAPVQKLETPEDIAKAKKKEKRDRKSLKKQELRRQSEPVTVNGE